MWSGGKVSGYRRQKQDAVIRSGERGKRGESTRKGLRYDSLARGLSGEDTMGDNGA